MKFSDITLGLLAATLLSSSALADPGVHFGQMDTISAIAGNGGLLVGSDGDQLEIGGTSPFTELGYADGNSAHITLGLSSSYDGSVLVGTYFDGSWHRAFRYEDGAFHRLDDFGVNAYAVAVTDNGQDVAGWSFHITDSVNIASVWPGGGTAVTQLGSTSSNSQAFGISNNGIVVGFQEAGGANFPTSWTYDGSVHATTLPLAGHDEGIANAISRDGSTIVGEVSSSGMQDAVMWKSGTATLLNSSPGSSSDETALAVSQSGKIIVGASNGQAFRWTQATGLQNLNTLLTDASVIPPGTLTSAYGISDDGTVMIAHMGSEDVFVVYDTVFDTGGPIAGVTTEADVQAATQRLADQQRNMLIDSRATANVLLGMLQPPSGDSYYYAGGMFGSAEGFLGGQYTRNNVALHGGIAYGYQDYGEIDQSSAVTMAVAGRYNFEPLANGLRPYAEIGGWVTPNETLTFSRPYANGTGTATGTGNSGAYSYAGYGQLGLTWKTGNNIQLSAFGELGEQTLNYDSYSEAISSANPFPASIAGGEIRYDVTRLGGSLSRTMENGNYPITATVSGALAHAFNVQSNLRVDVSGVGSTQGAATQATWGEYGTQLSVNLTQQLTASAGVIATTGNSGMGTQLHGLAGLSYKF